MNMVKRKLLLISVLLYALALSTQGALRVHLGESVDDGTGNYSFPDATVSGLAADRGYVIRIMFTRAVTANDYITLFTPLPASWTENALISTQHVRMIDIPTGATASELETYLRKVKIRFDPSKIGHSVMIHLSESMSEAGRNVYYSAATEHWYEYVREQKGPVTATYPYGQPYEWWEAYNRALDTTFLGVHGYLATITSADENDFIFTISHGKMGWLGGTRADIRNALDSDGRHLTHNPGANTLGVDDATMYLGYWYWAAGPEWDGTKSVSFPNGNPLEAVFDSRAPVGTNSGVTVIYPYTHWGTPYGNDNCPGVVATTGEQYLHLGYSDGTDFWNDYCYRGYEPHTYDHASTIAGSIVEYEGLSSEVANDRGIVGFECYKRASIVGGEALDGTLGNPVTVFFNENIRYQLQVANTSAVNTVLDVKDTIAQYLKVIPASISDGGSYNAFSHVLSWHLTSVPPETRKTLTYEVTPETSSCIAQPLWVNVAYATSDDTVTLRTNKTFHQGGGAAIITFSATYGGDVYNGETQAVDFKTTARSGVIAAPEDGYVFTGWSHPKYTSLRGEEIPEQKGIMEYDTLTIYGNVNLTANFDIEQYPITYYLNNSEASNPNTYNIKTSTFSLAEPKKAGDTFIGWTGSNGDTPQKDVFISNGSTGSLTYFANFLKSGNEVSNDAIENGKAIWAYDNKLCIKTAKTATASIYTTNGTLYKQQVISGTTTFELPQGLYIVTIDNNPGVKIRIK